LKDSPEFRLGTSSLYADRVALRLIAASAVKQIQNDLFVGIVAEIDGDRFGLAARAVIYVNG